MAPSFALSVLLGLDQSGVVNRSTVYQCALFALVMGYSHQDFARTGTTVAIVSCEADVVYAAVARYLLGP